jgi:predicted NBD/HSP70 family sugar kinase
VEPIPTGARQGLRGVNSYRLLLTLKEKGPLPKGSLCDICNLSRPTVDRIVREFLERGIVKEDGRMSSSGGRRPVLYRFNERAGYVIGVDLEIPQLELVVTDLHGQPLARRARRLPDAERVEPVLQFVRDEVLSLAEEAAVPWKRVVGIGLGAPAFLNGDLITISGRNLPPWTDVPAKAILEESLKVPVYVDNDANYMALAESYCMSYTDEVLVYVTLRQGARGDIRMGGSVLIEGRVFHGAHGNAVSLQHAYVEPGEEGRLEQILQEALSSSGDLRRTISKLKERLIVQILNLVTLFDPTQVVINAEILGRYESLFIEECEEVLKSELGENLGWQIKVARAQDREFTCAKGAALFVLQDLFSRPERLAERLAC